MNNLAVLYHDRAADNEAEPLYRRALEARERLLGPGASRHADKRAHLAELYQVQGRYAASRAAR